MSYKNIIIALVLATCWLNSIKSHAGLPAFYIQHLRLPPQVGPSQPVRGYMPFHVSKSFPELLPVQQGRGLAPPPGRYNGGGGTGGTGVGMGRGVVDMTNRSDGACRFRGC
jgi:hypothetical protein